jgi:hypothetical protein
MISAKFARSGEPATAALITSAHSRKYCGPIPAGVITQSAFNIMDSFVIELVNGTARNA